uniref:Uncharacterized protein n=1 Tax=Oryza glumipatula TaxID=40148 RepID=A0A0E0BFU3_9ORYZ
MPSIATDQQAKPCKECTGEVPDCPAPEPRRWRVSEHRFEASREADDGLLNALCRRHVRLRQAHILLGDVCNEATAAGAAVFSEEVMIIYLVDKIVSLEDVEHDGANDRRLKNPCEDLHQKPSNPWS